MIFKSAIEPPKPFLVDDGCSVMYQWCLSAVEFTRDCVSVYTL